VIGKTHGRFWKHFATLPVSVQKLAREKYALWKRDPFLASYQASALRLTFVSFAIFCSNHRNLKQKAAKQS
jgi:hypothetical protein